MEKFIADRIVIVNVDIQNDFMPGGTLAVPGGDQVIDALNLINAFTRDHNGIVVATGDQHPDTTPHFGPDAWPVHCVAGTPGAKFDNRLDIQKQDFIINKGMGQTDGYSAFEGVTADGKTLEQIISPKKHERVAALFGGVATEYCVLNTVLDGTKVNPDQGELQVYVIKDAIRGINKNDANDALDQMTEAGAITIDSHDVLTQKAIQLAR